MKILLTGILLLIITITYSQTVEELEYELSFYKSGETWGNKKETAYKLLGIDSLNRDAFNYLVEVYGRQGQKDSIHALFNKIIEDNPNSPIPYIIRADERNANFEGQTYTQQITNLRKAYNLDSNNVEAIYALGKLYYDLFIKEYSNDNIESNLDYYSNNSIQYFSILCKQKEIYKETLKYPLIQLANYQRDKSKLNMYESYNLQTSYFPVFSFMSLPNDWKTNYSMDVLEGIMNSRETQSFEEICRYTGVESAIYSIDWYSKHLLALNEPKLSDSLPTKIYRFTYLRSFDNPIVIRIENSNDTIMIYWKVSNGAGGYEPGEIIENKTKKLTIADWEKIENKINSIKFWSLPTIVKGLLGTDGSQWILEGTTLGKYHIVDRWCGGTISSVCKDLIDLTDLIIKEEDIY